MSNSCKIVLAQLNFRVGDIDYNLTLHRQAIAKARAMKANVIIFPELSITSYPPEDLLLRESFIKASDNAVKQLLTDTTDLYCLIGHPVQTESGIINACSVLYNGKIICTHAKTHLPNYGVFDEKRYFVSADSICIINVNDIQIGVVICEDLWKKGAAEKAVKAGAQLILSPNASPYETDKYERRIAMAKKRCHENRVPIAYVNLIGGQDELIFDGGSFVMNSKGEVCKSAGFFTEDLLSFEVDVKNGKADISKEKVTIPDTLTQIYQALVLGLRDYVQKNNFNKVLLGLSGGIDSALTLAIAVDALGKDAVTAVTLPSRYTAEMSLIDAKQLAKNLNVELQNYSIEASFEAFLQTLNVPFKDTQSDITEENIQARARAVILMALANKFNYLVLTTGNRSELAVGYCTLYGDMAGGFAPLKDVPKTLVYALARYRNQQQPIIPDRIIERAPTAELAPNQTDQDSLPPYETLDKILEMYLNQNLSVEEIVKAGFNTELVTKIVKLIKRNEYKRRQAAIGPRINHHSFGRDWRYPICNGFKH